VNRPLLRIFVSSPSDVLPERDAAGRIAHQLELERIVDLRFVRWEKLCADKGSFQDNIDRVASKAVRQASSYRQYHHG
jgi:hypothetical protein